MNDYEKALQKSGVLSFTPGGNSMWPIIKNKGATVIIKTPTGDLKKYDVAFYRRDDSRVVLHRVMKVKSDSYDMCGDSQYILEKDVPKTSVFGVLSGYYVGEKYIDCSKSVSYKLMVRLWSFSLFFRHVMLKALRTFGIKPQ